MVESPIITVVSDILVRSVILPRNPFWMRSFLWFSPRMNSLEVRFPSLMNFAACYLP